MSIAASARFIVGKPPDDGASLVVDAIGAGSDRVGRYSVVEHDRIRTAPLPGAGSDQ
jgi:hypothetical protein